MCSSDLHFSEELAIDPDRSLAEGAILPWKTKPYFLTKIALFAKKYGWDLTPRYGDLDPRVRNFILHGSDDRVPMVFEEKGMESTYMGRYEGLLNWLEARWQDTESETVQEELAAYRVEDVCKSCGEIGRAHV